MVGYSADDYLRFSADKETIYYSEPVYACEDAYVLPTNDNSEQWGVRSDGHWTYVNCLMYSFPPQGWKIHITSTIYDAQNVLYDVAEYLFVKSISFKYLSSRTCFIQANGKYADRLESGKFITIYPSSEHIFIQLLKDLKTIVCKYDDGPYILTDKQWQNSNVFFRYGALKPRFSNEKNVPVIVTPQGDLIPDKELPLYSLPSFVDEPIYVKENNYLNIYGSQYGTAKAYATKLSEITEIPCISYENIKDIKDYEQIIYFGGLYAGGVKGLKNTFRLLKNSNIKTILVTVGLADVNNKENTNNIKASLEKQLEKDIYKNSLIFHLRGGIDYSKLNFKHKTMMKMLYHSLKNKPIESLTQEDKALIETYNTKVDFVDYDSLKQIVEVIQ